jgi:hypothetical protein
MKNINIGIQLYSVRDEIKKYGIDTYILEVEYYPCDYVEYIKKSVTRINEFYKKAKEI